MNDVDWLAKGTKRTNERDWVKPWRTSACKMIGTKEKKKSAIAMKMQNLHLLYVLLSNRARKREQKTNSNQANFLNENAAF